MRTVCKAGTAEEALLIRVSIDGPVGLDTVDALARLQLIVRRDGGRMRLHEPGADLLDLLELAGLREVLCEDRYADPGEAASAVGMGREAEPGEQARIEEVVDVSDPPA